MMINLRQLGSQNEQEITALFLTYLPLEPLPMGLAHRLKTRVLAEVKNTLGRPPLMTAPFALSWSAQPLQRGGHWQLGVIIFAALVAVLVGLLYAAQLLVLYF